jgi:hypothetical protein
MPAVGVSVVAVARVKDYELRSGANIESEVLV